MAFLKILSTLLLIQLVKSATSYSTANADFTSDVFHHIGEENADKFVLVSPVSVRSPLYSKANADFTSDFFHHITEENADKNVLVSPASVQICLAMAYMGAKGITANEMVKGLHFTTEDKHKISERAKKDFESLPSSIKIANRIYLNKHAKIKPGYNSLVKNAFKVDAENLDFTKAEESANTINKWVESNTNDRIKNLVSPKTVRDAHMILVNAVHFKGEWVNTFPNAVKSDFWYNENSKTQIDMMKQTDFFNYAEIKELDAKIIEMPYRESDFSMLVILPNKRDGLQALENKLQDTDLMTTVSELKHTRVHLELPKFEFEYEINLNNILKKMGMTTMFSDTADFSDLSETNIQISEVVHKAFIKVNEKGSEAAAATYIAMVPLTMSMTTRTDPPQKFIADHPFVFAIKDKNAVYFIGHVVKF